MFRSVEGVAHAKRTRTAPSTIKDPSRPCLPNSSTFAAFKVIAFENTFPFVRKALSAFGLCDHFKLLQKMAVLEEKRGTLFVVIVSPPFSHCAFFTKTSFKDALWVRFPLAITFFAPKPVFTLPALPFLR